MLAYENEAILAQNAGEDVDYVVPDDTILIQNPIALTKSGADKPVAKDFLDFLFTPDTQRIFADNGYRPVVDGVAKPDEFPDPSGLFTIDDLGGWTKVQKDFFDPENSVMADVERGIGVSTGA
jgi:sulfate transport system substrate-binding protein